MNLSISEAAAKIRAGEVVAFPTETVYGLGVNALDAAAVGKVYRLKGRPAASPLIVHVASVEMARELAAEWPRLADELARRWWPGPLTLVLPKKSLIPDIVTAGLATVGIRMPNHALALDLIRAAGVPIAAPSANRFMGLSPTTPAHVREAFGESVAVLEGGPSRVGIESTVVAIENGRLTLLRPGMISLGDTEAIVASQNGAHPSPGLHQRHYSPRTPLLLVSTPKDLPDRTGAYLWHHVPGIVCRSIHMPEDAAAYGARLYVVLHELDAEGWPWIGVEVPPDAREWDAIRDRLQRAAGVER